MITPPTPNDLYYIQILACIMYRFQHSLYANIYIYVYIYIYMNIYIYICIYIYIYVCIYIYIDFIITITMRRNPPKLSCCSFSSER